jgi:hypothetical protein
VNTTWGTLIDDLECQLPKMRIEKIKQWDIENLKPTLDLSWLASIRVGGKHVA